MNTISINDYRKIVILTGAGISAASGLRTYRGPDGLWHDEDRVKYAHVETWRTDPAGVWAQFAGMREAVSHAEPNAAHRALAEVQRRLADGTSLHLVTQNVDGLHQAAGSHGVVELHGNLRRTRCSNDDCALAAFDDARFDFPELPRCSLCGELLRPDVVLFGEVLPWQAERSSKAALRECDLFLAIGTSGTVTPAANFVRSANYEGARTVLVNLEPMTPANPYFDTEILGRAEVLLPELLASEI